SRPPPSWSLLAGLWHAEVHWVITMVAPSFSPVQFELIPPPLPVVPPEPVLPPAPVAGGSPINEGSSEPGHPVRAPMVKSRPPRVASGLHRREKRGMVIPFWLLSCCSRWNKKGQSSLYCYCLGGRGLLMGHG